MSLESYKAKIEAMSKHHQIEILKIIKSESNVSINENKNGVYINLSYMESHVLDKIASYLKYVENQETDLGNLEHQMADYKNAYFNTSAGDDDSSNEVMTVYR